MHARIRRFAPLFAFILVSLTSTGCMFEPLNETTLGSLQETVKFRGVTILPESTIQIDAAQRAGGLQAPDEGGLDRMAEDLPLRILIAEDEKDLRRFISLVLTECGYTVLEAENGEEALETFRENNTPIVLTDIKMPGMGGMFG